MADRRDQARREEDRYFELRVRAIAEDVMKEHAQEQRRHGERRLSLFLAGIAVLNLAGVLGSFVRHP